MAEDIRRDIYGDTKDGSFGIVYQAEVLNACRLKAVFLMESLFACAAGAGPLREVVNEIQQRGQEVQLHIHTEWLARTRDSTLPGRRGQNLTKFTANEQAILVARGLENLQNAGAKDICAFRAGNYGVNFDTLLALRKNGILFDTSHNAAYLWDERGLLVQQPLLQPRKFEGVYEIPITCVYDFRGRQRSAEPSALSSDELEGALLEAWKRGWYSFVLVSHSFEMLRIRESPRRALGVDGIVVKRWERLCRFLGANRDKFRTGGFSEIDPDSIPSLFPDRPLTVPARHTALRYVEQLARRVG